uniref:Keratin 98 n=1 Tax=Xiphophorus couchianus TaxID=32473 RepID=A0A3B5LYG5_9TELE
MKICEKKEKKKNPSPQASSFQTRSLSFSSLGTCSHYLLTIISSCSCWFRSKLSKMSLSSRSFGQRSTGQKTMSVYGGAGGSGTRISVGQIDYLSRSGAINTNNLDLHVDANEKATLQNLNDRLASYLEKVHKLEKENERLEKQIAEWYTSKTVIRHDYSAYMATIEDLQNKIREATMVNGSTYLEIDNSKLAADDFKMKYETELSMRQAVEADIAGLKRVVDDLTMCKMDLESQQESLKEELIMLKRNHEEVKLQRKQISMLKVDAGVGANVLPPHAVEPNYEKTKQKFFLLPQQKSSLEATLLETQQRYAAQLSGLQDVVTGLEAQLSSLSENIREMELKYGNLLDIKTRLELEISEYRRLLDGEDVGLNKHEVIISFFFSFSNSSSRQGKMNFLLNLPFKYSNL